MNEQVFEAHAVLCRTLADAKRLKIIYLLGKGEKTVSELTELMGISQSNVSQHLGVLRNAGVVEFRRKGTKVYYRLAFLEMIGACNTIRGILLKQVDRKNKAILRGK